LILLSSILPHDKPGHIGLEVAYHVLQGIVVLAADDKVNVVGHDDKSVQGRSIYDVQMVQSIHKNALNDVALEDVGMLDSGSAHEVQV
jgi:hypothetical protein